MDPTPHTTFSIYFSGKSSGIRESLQAPEIKEALERALGVTLGGNPPMLEPATIPSKNEEEQGEKRRELKAVVVDLRDV